MLEAAQQGLVLLLNKHKTLPLSRVNVKRLALVRALGVRWPGPCDNSFFVNEASLYIHHAMTH